MKKVLIIAPHPSDETFGMGGTILKHKVQCDEIHWLVLTKPEESKWSEKEYISKLNEIEKACKYYDFKSIRRLNFIENKLFDAVKTELIDLIRGNIEIIKPDVLYFPYPNDFSEDYNISFDYIMKSIFNTKIKEILCYEIISSYNFTREPFNPNVFVDISDCMNEKIEVINIYNTEIEGYPMPKSTESIKAQAKTIGASIKTEYAEAFMLIRKIK